MVTSWWYSRARTLMIALIVVVAALLGSNLTGHAAAAVTCPNANPVVNENNCQGPGTTAWKVQNYSEDIGGFTTQTSYELGTDIPLKIGSDLSPLPTVNIDVYRMGWYGGTGGRLIWSDHNVATNNSYQCNPMDPTTGELSCANWNVTATIPGATLPISGIYEALITDPADNIQNYVVFVVRNDAANSPVLFVLPSATYEAYNTWGPTAQGGCKSLYFDNCAGANTVSGSGRAVAVSFDRPLSGGMAYQNRFFGPDDETVQWLEQQGYNVSYSDDVQTDESSSALLGHKIDIISGHSEYWSAQTFNNWMAARDAGVNIVSFSGNTAYWQTRYADGDRTLICYKTVQGPGTPNDPASLNSSGQVGPGDHPNLATTTRRDPGAPASAVTPPGGRIGPNQPENQLLGNMYIGDNDAINFSLTVPPDDNGGNFAGADVWRNSGISTSSTTTLGAAATSPIGWEWDSVPSANSPLYAYAASVEPVGVRQITQTDITNSTDSFIQDAGNVRTNTAPPGQPSNTSAVMYRAPSGAYVFASGSMRWAYEFGDPPMDQMTYNVFSDMGVQPSTPASDITLDPTGQPARPWASFSATPTTVHFGNPITFDASGTFVGSGATIVDYKWDFNGNGTFVDNGTSATVTHTFTAPGTYNVHLRVTDSLGRTDTTTRTIVITGDPPPVASFTVSPLRPVVGQQVTLDGSGSTAPKNPIVDYSWDLDGSGNYATDGGSSKTTTTTFQTPGQHTVGLKVTDSAGNSSTQTVTVTVLSVGASSYSDAVNATPGLLHYYKMGESAGPTVADSAGSSPATISGGTFGQPGPIAGDPTTAIAFNGTSDFGQAPINLSGQQTITVEFWLNWSAYANNDALAMELTPNFNNNNGGFLVDPNSTTGQFAVSIGRGSSRNTALFTRPSAGAWHYYAFVLDTTQPGATEITPYVDGQAVSYTKGGASGTGAGNFASSSLYLMSRGGTSLFGGGTLGQLTIYNGALDAQRVQDHYNSFGTNPRPHASLQITPSPAPVNQTVTFDASGSTYSKGSIVKYEWNVDGAPAGTYDKTTTTPTLTMSYPTSQTLNASVRVTDSDGGTDYVTKSLFVGTSAPVANVTATPNPGIVNQPITFDASQSSVPNGSIADVKWDFDGSGSFATDTGTTLTTKHAFTSTGNYSVGLQLTSNAGIVTTTHIAVRVLDSGVGDYEDAVLGTPGLLHYYKLGESSGPTIADSVSGGPSGTITGGTFGQPGAVANDPTTAISFNGTSDSGQVGMNLSGSKTITVEFWLKWNSYANNDALAMELTSNFNNTNGGFLVDPNSTYGQFAVSIGRGSSRNVAAFARPSAGQWHHYAFVLDTTQAGATEITPYVDGQPVSYTKQGFTGTGAGNFANSTLYLMSRAGTTLYGAGTLDQLAVYNGALTANQIQDHFYSSGTNQPPTAAFTTNPSPAGVGQQVTFDASGSTDPQGTITDYQWDLDGSGKFATDNGSNPKLTTTFTTPGTYSISLRVIDAGGASATVSHTLQVGSSPPVAAFSFSPSPLAYVGQPVSFDGSGSTEQVGTITDYTWDLDGSGGFATDTKTTPTTSFTYMTPGNYNVSLRVTNDQGQTSTVTKTVDVHAQSYKSTILGTPGLVNYWRMGDPAGSTALVDSAGTHNAANSGATLGVLGALFGDPGTAAQFGGSPAFSSSPLNLSQTSQVTVEGWLKWNAYANNDALAMELTPNYNNTAGGFLIDPNSSSGGFGLGIGKGSTRNAGTFPRPSAGVWHYYAFVFDSTQPAAGEITAYVDGKPVNVTLQSSGTGAGSFANSTLYMMSRAGTTLFGAGTLQEVAVYNKALSASTIAAHYAAGVQ
jgi:PKD repeat protein